MLSQLQFRFLHMKQVERSASVSVLTSYEEARKESTPTVRLGLMNDGSDSGATLFFQRCTFLTSLIESTKVDASQIDIALSCLVLVAAKLPKHVRDVENIIDKALAHFSSVRI